MTEDEILSHASRAIHDYLTRIRPIHGEFVLEDCLNRQVKELKRYASFPMDAKGLETLINHFLPKMREMARAVQLQYTKDQIMWKIKGTSAEAQIKSAFGDVGINATVEYQKYRAKVFADLGGKTVRFYVGYKALEDRDTLPELTQAVLDLKDALCRIGGDIRLFKA